MERHVPCGDVLVVDNGTGVVKAGWAGDISPRLVFPCVVGRSRRSDGSSEAVAVGHEVLEPWAFTSTWAPPSAAGMLSMEASYPMANGVVRRWDEMMLVWDRTWEGLLGVDSVAEADLGSRRVMLTDPALNPTANKQRMIELMLEQYGFAGVGMQTQAVLTLYAHGLDTGVVLDSGDGISHAVAVVEGYAFSHLTQRLELAGRHLTSYLMELLIRRGAELHRVHDMDAVRRIKEACCYVAVDMQREAKLARETTCVTKSFSLPDGRVIKVGPERFQAPEALFNPALLDQERPGIAHMIFNAINECDLDNRRRLYEQVVVSGGSTMFPGLPTRLESELKKLYLNNVLQGDTSRLKAMKIRVHDNTDRQNMVFRGAAILARLLQEQPDAWVTLHEWQEDPWRAMKRLGVVSSGGPP